MMTNAQSRKMLIDSDVLIWMMRGHVGAATRLQEILPWRISVVTYIELAQGCRNKQELTQAKKGLALCQTEILPINDAISRRAVALIDHYSLSHGLLLADALIAATAQEHGLTLLTANVKHFSAIENLTVEAFLP
jgi:predicted nucleic acid-binding protein